MFFPFNVCVTKQLMTVCVKKQLVWRFSYFEFKRSTF